MFKEHIETSGHRDKKASLLNSSSSTAPLPSHMWPTEQQCPLLPATKTCIQQRKGALDWEGGREKSLDAEEKSWHNTFRPSQLFEGRSIANHYPIVVPCPTITGVARGGGWLNPRLKNKKTVVIRKTNNEYGHETCLRSYRHKGDQSRVKCNRLTETELRIQLFFLNLVFQFKYHSYFPH